MSGHLSLKWNNHSSSLLRSLTKVQTKEQYCDATIACQGKYFPVHRIVLSTCSEYFEEIFERIQNQHPYIIFKDIDPREMELLLNYMYQGEVNVLQENLPMLIKAAEALKIKGLAVPDDVPVKEPPPPTKKRSSNSTDYPHAKRRPEEKRRRRESNEGHSSNNENDESYTSENYAKNHPKTDNSEELKVIKEEPVDTSYEDNDLSKNFELPITEGKIADSNNEMQDFTSLENVTFAKDENIVPSEPFENQSSSWSTYNEGDQVGNLSAQDDIYPKNTLEVTTESCSGSHPQSPLDKSPNVQPYISQGNLSAPSTFEALSRNYISNTPKNNESYRGSHSQSPLDKSSNVQSYISQGNLSAPLTFEAPSLDCISNNEKNNVKLKRFACTVCRFRSHLRSDLDRHILVHTGEKPFSCLRCSRKFRQESHLRKHLSKKNLCFP